MEKLNGGGNVFIGGTIFISDFEVKATLDNYGDLQYANYNITLNILDSIKREVKVSTIKEAHNGQLGDFYCVEGYVTTGTQEGNSFFDTIYIQDSTGGINVFPVSGIDLKLGQKVRVTGLISEYEGEKEIDLDSIEIIDENINIVEATKLSTGDAGKKENEGLLISVTGKVIEIGENNSEYMILNDGSGNIRIFLNGYVGASDGSLEIGKFNSDIKVGDTVTAIGLGSTDTLGARLRVRDSIEVKKVEVESDNNTDNDDNNDNNNNNDYDDSIGNENNGENDSSNDNNLGNTIVDDYNDTNNNQSSNIPVTGGTNRVYITLFAATLLLVGVILLCKSKKNKIS